VFYHNQLFSPAGFLSFPSLKKQRKTLLARKLFLITFFAIKCPFDAASKKVVVAFLEDLFKNQ
jgi:hypothetical protein